MFETPICWVVGIEPHRLGLMARPCGDEYLCDEVEAWREANVNVVVSLLEAAEVRELGLSQEAALCAEYSIQFCSFPIPDRGVPDSARDFENFVEGLCQAVLAGKTVVIHCRAGIGRTGLVAGCLIYRLGVPLKNVFNVLSRSRGTPMPDTDAQVEWVEKYARPR